MKKININLSKLKKKLIKPLSFRSERIMEECTTDMLWHTSMYNHTKGTKEKTKELYKF